jgi:hypothetical protein
VAASQGRKSAAFLELSINKRSAISPRYNLVSIAGTCAQTVARLLQNQNGSSRQVADDGFSPLPFPSPQPSPSRRGRRRRPPQNDRLPSVCDSADFIKPTFFSNDFIIAWK